MRAGMRTKQYRMKKPCNLANYKMEWIPKHACHAKKARTGYNFLIQQAALEANLTSCMHFLTAGSLSSCEHAAHACPGYSMQKHAACVAYGSMPHVVRIRVPYLSEKA